MNNCDSYNINFNGNKYFVNNDLNCSSNKEICDFCNKIHFMVELQHDGNTTRDAYDMKHFRTHQEYCTKTSSFDMMKVDISIK